MQMFLLDRLDGADTNLLQAHSDFAELLAAGRAHDFALLFEPDGLFRLRDAATGARLEEGLGAEGIASLARSLHENAQFLGLCCRPEGGLASGCVVRWYARLRNWGCGSTVKASGWLRIETAHARVRVADFAMEQSIYRTIFRPGPWDDAHPPLRDSGGESLYSLGGRC